MLYLDLEESLSPIFDGRFVSAFLFFSIPPRDPANILLYLPNTHVLTPSCSLLQLPSRIVKPPAHCLRTSLKLSAFSQPHELHHDCHHSAAAEAEEQKWVEPFIEVLAATVRPERALAALVEDCEVHEFQGRRLAEGVGDPLEAILEILAGV